MQALRESERKWDVLWLVAWALASSIWCVTAAGRLSATFDEPFYVSRGLERWRTGSYARLLSAGTMPLPVDVQTLPLYLWERWRGVPFDPDLDWDRLLPWARAATLPFWWLLLFYGGRTAQLLGGPWAGRLAIALLAVEPSLLAHAGLATTDLALTACLLALCYHFRTGRTAGWGPRIVMPAVWFGAAVLAKASAIVFGPLCLIVIEFERLARRADPRDPVRPSLWAILRQLTGFMRRDLAVIMLGGFVLVFSYCGSDWTPQRSFGSWAHQLPDGWGAWILTGIADNLRIFPNAGDGLVRQIQHNIRGHGAYLLGHTAPRALWYYFPVLVTIKLSLPVLLGLLGLLLLRPRTLANWASLAAAALLVFSLCCRVQLGIRMVLPLVVLAIVGLAAAAVQTFREIGPGWRPLLAGGLVLGVVWTTSAALRVWPHGLCYVNELWGGTADGYHLVSEANYDWGQGLKELAQWRAAHANAALDVWYFGTDPTFERLPVRNRPLHAMPITSAAAVREYEQGHFLAVSTTMLYGIEFTEAQHQAIAFLHTCQPVGRTTTFLIYDFTQEQISHGHASASQRPARNG
jgi:hypothetical protein